MFPGCCKIKTCGRLRPRQRHDRTDEVSPLVLVIRHSTEVALAGFSLSGAAGLQYEVAWSRQASLLLGSPRLVLSTVPAVFLSGWNGLALHQLYRLDEAIDR